MRSYAFIDASNLFYGGEKSLGWRIDYEKLLVYLRGKYEVSRALYFGGVEVHGFKFDYLQHDTVPLNELVDHLSSLNRNPPAQMGDEQQDRLFRDFKRARFYQRLSTFGYELFLKPVKFYRQVDGSFRRKANCDVELTFRLMLEAEKLDRVVFLSGDGDFLPVLKHARSHGKQIVVLARGPRTAREIRQFAGGNFRDFEYLKYLLTMQK